MKRVVMVVVTTIKHNSDSTMVMVFKGIDGHDANDDFFFFFLYNVYSLS